MHTEENNQGGLIKGLSLILIFLFLFPAHALLQDKKGVEELIRDLQADKPLVRRAAAEQLGKSKDARGVEPLLTALRDDDEGVRREVTKALGEIEDALIYSRGKEVAELLAQKLDYECISREIIK